MYYAASWPYLLRCIYFCCSLHYIQLYSILDQINLTINNACIAIEPTAFIAWYNHLINFLPHRYKVGNFETGIVVCMPTKVS